MSGRRSALWFTVSFVCVLCLFTSATVFADNYVEDFTSKQYCDIVNTTAWWDTVAGQLKLPPFELTLAGTKATSGTAYATAISGNYAYVAVGTSGLYVVDISDPENPAYASSYNTSGTSYDIKIAGDYAYVADGSSGLQVIDISDPTYVTLAGTYNTSGTAHGVAIAGDHAYVADGTQGLQVIDISNPASPTLAGSYNTPGDAYCVAISGDHAYVADVTMGIRVIDITDPTTPTEVGSVATSAYAYGVTVAGGYAYVADGTAGLRVIDISDPTHPTFAGSCGTPSTAWSVEISGDWAYVASTSAGLQVIDISDPTAPVSSGAYDTPGTARGVAIAGEHAFVADGTSGLQVIDVCDLTGPRYAGRYTAAAYAYGLAISGNHAYEALDALGLYVLDISDPASPALAGTYNTPGSARDVSIAGDYAYVADGASGLQVIDISDPAHPTLAGSCDMPGSARGVVVAGDYAYVADSDSGLKVVDISNPALPSLVGGYDTPGRALGVTVSGDYAYVADDFSGLQVIDISAPTSPVVAGSYDTNGYAGSVAISGDYAYVGDQIGGLDIINISDPTNPVWVNSSGWVTAVYDIKVSGDYAYVADYGSGLTVMDISNPIAAITLGVEATNTSGVLAVEVSGDHAYAAIVGGFVVCEVHQRSYDTLSDAGRSLTIAETDEVISAARLSANCTASVEWELSADGGSRWEDFPADGAFHTFTSALGTDLRWRSHHEYVGNRINPMCSDLWIDWLYRDPVIVTVTDIPNDQGKQVSLSWTRSGYDLVGSDTPVVEYAVYRRIDDDLSTCSESEDAMTRQTLIGSQVASGPGHRAAGAKSSDENPFGRLLYPPGEWHFITTVPADAEEGYAVVVPTLADSTVAEGMYFTTFFVRARTATPGVYFDSDPDSGYSMDNLAPSPPSGLMMASATDLAWDECPDADFDYFAVYGSDVPILDLTAVVVGYTIDTEMDVTGADFDYYHVTATDFAGNEGDASSIANTYAGASADVNLPQAFALKANRPNPFTSSTAICFDLPEPCAVRLEVADVHGRVVRLLTDTQWPAGRHSVIWTGVDDEGQLTGPGVYFTRIQAGAFSATNKMLRMK